MREEDEDLNEPKNICPKCGSLMVQEDGKYVCPHCDGEIDFFGEDSE